MIVKLRDHLDDPALLLYWSPALWFNWSFFQQIDIDKIVDHDHWLSAFLTDAACVILSNTVYQYQMVSLIIDSYIDILVQPFD